MAKYDERLARYRIAMANGRPHRIPIRPFVAELLPSLQPKWQA